MAWQAEAAQISGIFGLWALAVIYLVTGARLLNGGVYDIFPLWLYEKYPGLKVVNIVSGMAYIALGAGLGIICVRLAKFRKGAPDQLTTILGVCLIIKVIYVVTVSVIVHVSTIRYHGDSLLIELLIDAVLIGILAAYYDARKELFQK